MRPSNRATIKFLIICLSTLGVGVPAMSAAGTGEPVVRYFSDPFAWALILFWTVFLTVIFRAMEATIGVDERWY